MKPKTQIRQLRAEIKELVRVVSLLRTRITELRAINRALARRNRQLHDELTNLQQQQQQQKGTASDGIRRNHQQASGD